MSTEHNLPKKAAGGAVKFVMGVLLLAGLFGIPYFVFSESWSFIVRLYHEHIVWFVVLVIPIVFLTFKVWKWLTEFLGLFLAGIGKVVDKLEQ